MRALATQLDEAVSELLSSLPGFLDGIWRLVATMRWRGPAAADHLGRTSPHLLVRDLLFGALIGAAVAVIAGEVVVDDGWGVLSGLFELDDPPAFPPGLVTLTAAASSRRHHHTSPARSAISVGGCCSGRQWLWSLLGAAVGLGGGRRVAIGLLAAAVVHLAVGSPGGRPDAARASGWRCRSSAWTSTTSRRRRCSRDGRVLFEGRDADGPLSVKVYGRDAWDGQLLSTVWRLAWYRDTATHAPGTARFELVEHEGFVTLLAERAGVPASRTS